MIVTPYGYIKGQYPSEIVGSIGADGRYLCPPDKMYYSQGEEGYYHDTPLGSGGASGPQIMAQGPAPSDFQTASAYRYTPANRNWVASREGYIQGPYYPQPPGGMAYPMSPLPLQFGDASSAAAAQVQSVTGYTVPGSMEAMEQEARRKNVVFWMSVVTSAVIGGSALMAIYRGIRGLRHDQIIRHALEKKLL